VLQGISFVDSQDDPRVQLADFLAGASRRIASQVLAGAADPVLVELISPYVSPRSTWVDVSEGRDGIRPRQTAGGSNVDVSAGGRAV
jgi:hypothetical protein